jgi:hypothetical protein
MINKKYGKDIASGRHAMRKLRTEVGHLSLHTRARWRPFLRYPHSEDGIHINLKYNLTVCAEDKGSGKRAERRVTAEHGMLSHEEIEGMLQAACEEKEREREALCSLTDGKDEFVCRMEGDVEEYIMDMIETRHTALDILPALVVDVVEE